MYESFYGLSGKPFQLNPDPKFYFDSRQHRRATAYLEYGLHQNEGFIVVTGEVGAGKTTIVRNLLSKLNPQHVVAAQLVSTQLEADDTLRMIAAGFGLRTKGIDKTTLLLSLEAFLVWVSQQGKRTLLIVDEAQNLSLSAIEELRMLSNFQLETHALLQSFLVGQPEFRRTMQSAEMLQLRQRVIAACHIGAMDAHETRGYIEHRLHRVDWTGSPEFADSAHEAIYRTTGGIPRRINSLCDRLLLFGFLNDKRSFAGADVCTVAREMSEETLETGSGEDAERTEVGGVPARVARPVSHDALGPDADDLHIDVESAIEASQLIANLQVSSVHERLTRLEHRTDAVLSLLGQLLKAIRMRTPTR